MAEALKRLFFTLVFAVFVSGALIGFTIFFVLPRLDKQPGQVANQNPFIEGGPIVPPAPAFDPADAGHLFDPQNPQRKIKSAEKTEAIDEAAFAKREQESRASAKEWQRESNAIYERVKQDIDKWENDLLAWNKQMASLFLNEDGRKIATDASEVRRFRGAMLLVNESSRKPQLDEVREFTERSGFEIRQALKNPQDKTMEITNRDRLRAHQAMAVGAQENLKEARSAIQGILASVKSKRPGERSLQEAKEAIEQEEAAARAAVVDEEVRKARVEGAKILAQEKVKLARIEAEAQAAEVRNQAALKKQEMDLAAARTIEQMELKQKEATAEIARLRDVAEQRRQGDLRPGSVWKGSFTFQGKSYESTMTIESRTNDQIQGSFVNKLNGMTDKLTFRGTVKGATLRLIPAILGEDLTLECTYAASAKTINGANRYQTFNVRLSDSKDE